MVQDGNSVTPVTSVDLGHTRSALGKVDVHEAGVFFASSVVADGSHDGLEFQVIASSDISTSSRIYLNRSIKVKAGQTTVYAINGDNREIVIGDYDGDLIPNFIEKRLIDADPNDGLRKHADVTARGDLDGDGLNNLLETVMGTDHLVADDEAIAFTRRGNRLVVTHRESKMDYGLKFVGQRSPDLESWTPNGVETEVIEEGPESLVREWRIPLGDGGEFLQLFVERH